ncbi:MAG: AraC family transcriptional regulator [Spirosomataceae bacterium]
MKIQFEEIQPDTNSSFRWMINPRLNDFFFWHFHPEYELVFIEAPSGTRHVGEHIARFEGSDLVLIGSNIPHLNFDYGIKTNYEKTVLHIRPDFLGQAIAGTPELQPIAQLLNKAKYGITFGQPTKNKVGEMFKRIHLLPAFEQFVEVLRLLTTLSEATDTQLLHSKPVENRFQKREQERLQRLYRFIEEHYQRKIDIVEVAELCHLSNEAFCRYFKKMTLLTFTQFLNNYRVNQAKMLLHADKTITETCFECGFESLSYFNRTFKKVTGQSPLTFKKHYFDAFRSQ